MVYRDTFDRIDGTEGPAGRTLEELRSEFEDPERALRLARLFLALHGSTGSFEEGSEYATGPA